MTNFARRYLVIAPVGLLVEAATVLVVICYLKTIMRFVVGGLLILDILFFKWLLR
jgi:hypothetical protein